MQVKIVERRRDDDYELSTDPRRLDFAFIHLHLNQTYWAQGRPLQIVRRAFENSVAFGIYRHDLPVGFARVVTDGATFAYVADFFIHPDHRGRGLSKWLMAEMLAHPDLQGLRRWTLATKDAHGLYAQFGFGPFRRPERWMERLGPGAAHAGDYWDETQDKTQPAI